MSYARKMLVVIYVMCAMSLTSAELSLISRADWLARPPSGELTPQVMPLGRAIIAHTAGRDCSDDAGCADQVRNIQAYQMNVAKYSDISYHYLIGGNGRVYEGRNPLSQGAVVYGQNAGTLAIAFVGTFNKQAPTDAALAAGQELLAHAVSQGQLAENYQLFGHRQLSATESPGQALYALVQKWPHWSSSL